MGQHHVPSQTKRKPMVKRYPPSRSLLASAGTQESGTQITDAKPEYSYHFSLWSWSLCVTWSWYFLFLLHFFLAKNQGREPCVCFFWYSVFFSNVLFGQNYSIYKDTLPPKTKQFAPENRLKNRHPAKRKVVSQLPEHHFSGTKPRSHARSMPNPCLTSAKIA